MKLNDINRFHTLLEEAEEILRKEDIILSRIINNARWEVMDLIRKYHLKGG